MKQIHISIILISGLFVFFACSSENKESTDSAAEDDPTDVQTGEQITSGIDALTLQEGFEISIYASGLENPRSMALSPNGIVYVGSLEDKVYALTDENKDGEADEVILLASGLEVPNGVAFRDGSLYVAEISRLWRYDNMDENVNNPSEPVLIYDDYPSDHHHGWKYIAFGPDNKLYVPVGAPCNICESEDERYASITRMDADGSNREVFAHGVRNTVGLTWHPESGELWFTDNGRDLLGDNLPDCELNIAKNLGQHFGYPYCHSGDIGDPEFGSKFACSDFVQPEYKLGPHVAPLGLKFYTGSMFPADYSGDLLIAKHGSWNRSRKIGYEVTRVKVENGRAVGEEKFITGWLNEDEQEEWGRPVDILLLDDGSVLISDDEAGYIYRVTYVR